jgi:hypothetical protein
MAAPAGFNQAQELNNQAFQSAFTTIATMTGTPLIGNPEATAVRLEELTSVVGTLAEALVHAVPLLNNNAVGVNLLAGHATNLEAQVNTVEMNPARPQLRVFSLLKRVVWGDSYDAFAKVMIRQTMQMRIRML